MYTLVLAGWQQKEPTVLANIWFGLPCHARLRGQPSASIEDGLL